MLPSRGNTPLPRRGSGALVLGLGSAAGVRGFSPHLVGSSRSARPASPPWRPPKLSFSAAAHRGTARAVAAPFAGAAEAPWAGSAMAWSSFGNSARCGSSVAHGPHGARAGLGWFGGNGGIVRGLGVPMAFFGVQIRLGGSGGGRCYLLACSRGRAPADGDPPACCGGRLSCDEPWPSSGLALGWRTSFTRDACFRRVGGGRFKRAATAGGGAAGSHLIRPHFWRLGHKSAHRHGEPSSIVAGYGGSRLPPRSGIFDDTPVVPKPSHEAEIIFPTT